MVTLAAPPPQPRPETDRQRHHHRDHLPNSRPSGRRRLGKRPDGELHQEWRRSEPLAVDAAWCELAQLQPDAQFSSIWASNCVTLPPLNAMRCSKAESSSLPLLFLPLKRPVMSTSSPSSLKFSGLQANSSKFWGTMANTSWATASGPLKDPDA